ncbi:hypothetical protein [Micromonospora chalcea]|uniref:hypothetical protein n=1 Tax=Micromonospora chalcea TaxID=1874 RepID=UPI0011B0207D|nr:hypothetical protein [Micromonospora chalcea]
MGRAETDQPARLTLPERPAPAPRRRPRPVDALVVAGYFIGPRSPVRATVDALLGPGRDVPGGHLWDVRGLVG